MNSRAVVVSGLAVVLLAGCNDGQHVSAPSAPVPSVSVPVLVPPAPVPTGKVTAPALPHLGGLGGGLNGPGGGLRVPRLLRRLGQKNGGQ